MPWRAATVRPRCPRTVRIKQHKDSFCGNGSRLLKRCIFRSASSVLRTPRRQCRHSHHHVTHTIMCSTTSHVLHMWTPSHTPHRHARCSLRGHTRRECSCCYRRGCASNRGCFLTRSTPLSLTVISRSALEQHVPALQCVSTMLWCSARTVFSCFCRGREGERAKRARGRARESKSERLCRGVRHESEEAHGGTARVSLPGPSHWHHHTTVRVACCSLSHAVAH